MTIPTQQKQETTTKNQYMKEKVKADNGKEITDAKLRELIEHNVLCALDNSKELYKRKPTNPLSSYINSLELLVMNLSKI